MAIAMSRCRNLCNVTVKQLFSFLLFVPMHVSEKYYLVQWLDEDEDGDVLYDGNSLFKWCLMSCSHRVTPMILCLVIITLPKFHGMAVLTKATHVLYCPISEQA